MIIGHSFFFFNFPLKLHFIITSHINILLLLIGDATELNIDNVGGVFVVLLIGIVFSVMGSIIELVYKTFKTPALSHVSLLNLMCGH